MEGERGEEEEEEERRRRRRRRVRGREMCAIS